MTLIVQLSDTHFGTEVPVVVDAAIRAVNTLRPDVVLISGDITQRARHAQFHAAADFLDALSVDEKLVIPGNHDIPLFNVFTRLCSPYRAYRSVFGMREASWGNHDAVIVGLDATSRWRHTRGALGAAHLAEKIRHARARFAPHTLLIACAHQPLHTAWPEDMSERLIDAEQTADACSALGVDVVLSGHVHVPLLTTTQAVFPRLGRHFILAGAGTALSHRIRPGAPNSFNTIGVATQDAVRTVAITQFVFDAQTGEFIAQPAVRFTSGTRGWQAQ